MNLADEVICLRRDDGVAAYFCAVFGVAPDVIEAGEGKDGFVADWKWPGKLIPALPGNSQVGRLDSEYHPRGVL